MSNKDKLTVTVDNLDKVVKGLRDIDKASQTVIERTVSDFASRAPAWVGAAVSEVYNIKKKDAKAALTRVDRNAGRIRIGGHKVDSVELVYFSKKRPNMISFQHTPRTTPTKRATNKVVIPAERVAKQRDHHITLNSPFVAVRPPAPYQVNVTEKRGKTLHLSSGAYIGKIRNDQHTVGIYQRTNDDPKVPGKAKALKGHSVAGMIDRDPEVQKKIDDKISDGMEKRFQNHLKTAIEKNL